MENNIWRKIYLNIPCFQSTFYDLIKFSIFQSAIIFDSLNKSKKKFKTYLKNDTLFQSNDRYANFDYTNNNNL